MRNSTLLFFMLFTNISLFSQNIGDWVMFVDKKTELKGYKDLQGNVKIKPKFVFLTSAVVFKNIVPVMEETYPENSKISKFENYYLLKNGKKIGKDSLYVWDFTLDCEQEGKIRFRDGITDKVGFFDKDGKVVIPAVYNDAHPFYNGLALTIKDAKRMCWNGVEYSKENSCEHWSWIGNTVLINTNNEIILEDLDFEEVYNLDWYSLKINELDLDDMYVSFKSKNGNTYSFIDTEKQFQQWFYQEFMIKNNTDQIENELFKTIIYRKKSDYSTTSKEKYFSKNKTELYKILDKINNESYEASISSIDMPSFRFDYKKYKEYFTDCGEYNSKKYPYFQVYIVERETRQVVNSLEFIRTTEGKYKLLEVD